MAKNKIVFVCSDCGNDFSKWSGQCPSCKAWDTLKEFTERASPKNSEGRKSGWVSSNENRILRADEVQSNDSVERLDTDISELNRVLGGGLTVGSINLISGDPGVGKSTLLIETMTSLSQVEGQKSLYVSGEESLTQIKNRANRLKLDDSKLLYLSETNVDEIISKAQKAGITSLVIDSIQTIYTNDSTSTAGSATQVKETAMRLTNFAKQNDVSIFLVGHVTKDGSMAGPKVLEHIVDSFLHLSGDAGSRYRLLRSVKNRFGEANETGVFAMTEKGMQEVTNPSAIFVSSSSEPVSGSSIFVSQEGNRPLLFEVQSLVTESFSEVPRRLSIGVNFQRVSMLLAIMQKHNNFRFFDKDVYVNVVGGITIPNTETSCDLGVCFSIYSSSEDLVIPKNVAAFGEISLSGEVRPVPNGEQRIREAERHGYTHIIVPAKNANEKLIERSKIKIIPVKTISEATTELHTLID